VAQWQERWEKGPRPYLRYRKAWSTIVIEDGRERRRREYQYSDEQALLYEYCADARTLKEISNRFGEKSWISGALEEFLAENLMLFLDGRYLSLALPENAHFDPAIVTDETNKQIATRPVVTAQQEIGA